MYIPEKRSLKAIIHEWKISPVTLEINHSVLHIFLWGWHCLFLKLSFLMRHFLNNVLILITSKLFYLGIFDSRFQKFVLFCFPQLLYIRETVWKRTMWKYILLRYAFSTVEKLNPQSIYPKTSKICINASYLTIAIKWIMLKRQKRFENIKKFMDLHTSVFFISKDFKLLKV